MKYPKIKIHLLDFCENALDYAKKLFKFNNFPCRVIQGSFLIFPFSDDIFDYVYANTVIEHVLDTEKAVKEVVRITKPDGIMVITCPNRYRRYDSHNLYHYIFRIKYVSKTIDPEYLKKLFLSENCEVIEEFGVSILSIYPSYFIRLFLEFYRDIFFTLKNNLKSIKTHKDSQQKQEHSFNKKDLTINITLYKRIYNTLFLPLKIIDKLWNYLIQNPLNILFNKLQISPKFYITFGLVVKKTARKI